MNALKYKSSFWLRGQTIYHNLTKSLDGRINFFYFIVEEMFAIKKKVSFFDKQLVKQFASAVSGLSILFSLVLIFVTIPDKIKTLLAFVFIALLIIGYLVMWWWANKILCRKLQINNSTVEVKIGDIFSESGLKAIAFNEYFDTQVDEVIIASTTLNGVFVKQKVDDIQSFDEFIINDTFLKEQIVGNNIERKVGKTIRYKLGSIFLYKQEYLLTAFSLFDNQNKAYLFMQDYLEFLINFWSEVDRVYAGRSVTIPLFGSGITRFREYNMISDQELLEILIWSFKISRIKFTYPAKVTIIINPEKKDKINFYDLKGGDCCGL